MFGLKARKVQVKCKEDERRKKQLDASQHYNWMQYKCKEDERRKMQLEAR